MVSSRHHASLHARLLVLLVIRVAKRLNSRNSTNYVSSDFTSLLTIRLRNGKVLGNNCDTSI